MEGAVDVGGVGDGDEAVVAIGFAVFGLFGFHDAEEADEDGAAGEDGFVHEDEDVEGVAVAADGLGDEAEVVGEDHAGGEGGFEEKDVLFLVEGVFVAAAAGGFDDDLDEGGVGLLGAGGGFAGLLLEGLELGGIRQALGWLGGFLFGHWITSLVGG